MKKLVLAIFLFLNVGAICSAQQSPADAPASKEDLEKYLQVMHSREMMTKMVDVMSKPMHDMIHEQYMKDKDKLPPDFEDRMNKRLDDLFKSMPWDELLQAMVPVYQKHFTKGDVDALIVFYSSPTGQKLLQEMPAITAESMQVVVPLMRQHMETFNKQIQEEIAAAVKDSTGKSRAPTSEKNN